MHDFLQFDCSTGLIKQKHLSAGHSITLSAAEGNAVCVSAEYTNLQSMEAGENLQPLRAVYWLSQKVYAADFLAVTAIRTSGISLNASLNGEMCSILLSGEVSHESFDLDTNALIYLGADGLLTQTPPEEGYLVILGYPISSTRLFIQIRPPILL